MTRPHTLGTVLHDGHLVGLHPILGGGGGWRPALGLPGHLRPNVPPTPHQHPASPLGGWSVGRRGRLGTGLSAVIGFHPHLRGSGLLFFVSTIFLLAPPHLLRGHYIKKFSIPGPSGLAYTPTAPGQRPLPLRPLIGLGKFLLNALLWIVVIALLVCAVYYILPLLGVKPSPS